MFLLFVHLVAALIVTSQVLSQEGFREFITLACRSPLRKPIRLLQITNYTAAIILMIITAKCIGFAGWLRGIMQLLLY